MTLEHRDAHTDVLLRVVADCQRRKILHYLQNGSELVVDVDDLADAIRGEVGLVDDDRADETDRVRLEHVQLPKLADAGLVEFDRRSATVRYTGGESVEQLVTFVEDRLE